MGVPVSRNMGIWARRLKHHIPDDQRFDGVNPVAILSFLSAFAHACNIEGIPEAAALQLIPHFLKDTPQLIFKGMVDNADAGFGGFNTWPGAVQFLLQHYATDANIEQAVEELESMRMISKEGISDFKNRLATAARDLAGAYPLDALVNRFIRALPDDIRDIIRHTTSDIRGPAALHVIAEKAAAFHASHARIAAKPKRGVSFKALSIEGARRRSSVTNLEPVPEDAPTTGDPVAMFGLNSKAERQVSDYTPTVEYSERFSETSEAETFAEVDAVVEQRPRTLSRGQIQRRHQESSLIPLVCFVCYMTGHRSTECRHRNRPIDDAEFQKWCVGNFNRLLSWQQEWLRSIGRAPRGLAHIPNTAPPPQNLHQPLVDPPRPPKQAAPTILQRPGDQNNTLSPSIN